MIVSSCGQALLFTKLMGPTVLSASIVQTPAPEPASPVRVYAHCARDRGVTVMLINLRSATTNFIFFSLVARVALQTF